MEMNAGRRLQTLTLSLAVASVLAVNSSAGSGQVITDKVAKADEAASVDDLPFRLLRGYVIVAEGSLGDLTGRHLLIDTGSSPTILDVAVARQLGLTGRRADLFLLNNDANVGTSLLSTLVLGPIRAHSLSVLIADLSLIQRDLGMPIDAIIGLDVLQTSFVIDYQSRHIAFGPSPRLVHSIPFETGAPFVTVTMRVDGEPVRLLVDTGASGLLLFHGEHYHFSAQPLMRVQSSTNITGTFDREQVELSNVRLGGLHRQRQTAYLVRTQEKASRDFDGLMGIPALGIKQVAFDFERGMLSWK